MTRSGNTPTALLPVHKDGADPVGTRAEINNISVAPYRGAQTSFHGTGPYHWICTGNSQFESLTVLAAEQSNREADTSPSRIHVHSHLTSNIKFFVHTVLHYASNYGSVRPTYLFLGHWGGLRSEYRYRIYGNKNTLDGGYSEGIENRALTNLLKAEVDGSTVPTTIRLPGLTEEQLSHVNLAYSEENQEIYLELEKRSICVAPSWHYHAKALDLTWVAWGGTDEFGREWLAHSRPCEADGDVELGSPQHRRLVAIEAALRKSFGTVIPRGYNQAHRNHFHVDIGTPVAPDFGEDKSAPNNLFIRDCIRAFTDYALPYERARGWDTDAEIGYAVLLSDLGMEGLDPHRTFDHYLLFLNFIMMHGFADKRAGHYRWTGGI